MIIRACLAMTFTFGRPARRREYPQAADVFRN
jgi:hypothetical protein